MPRSLRHPAVCILTFGFPSCPTSVKIETEEPATFVHRIVNACLRAGNVGWAVRNRTLFRSLASCTGSLRLCILLCHPLRLARPHPQFLNMAHMEFDVNTD